MSRSTSSLSGLRLASITSSSSNTFFILWKSLIYLFAFTAMFKPSPIQVTAVCVESPPSLASYNAEYFCSGIVTYRYNSTDTTENLNAKAIEYAANPGLSLANYEALPKLKKAICATVYPKCDNLDSIELPCNLYVQVLMRTV